MKIIKLISKLQSDPDNVKNYRDIIKLYREYGKLNEANAFEYLVNKNFKNDKSNNSNSDEK